MSFCGCHQYVPVAIKRYQPLELIEICIEYLAFFLFKFNTDKTSFSLPLMGIIRTHLFPPKVRMPLHNGADAIAVVTKAAVREVGIEEGGFRKGGDMGVFDLDWEKENLGETESK